MGMLPLLLFIVEIVLNIAGVINAVRILWKLLCWLYRAFKKHLQTPSYLNSLIPLCRALLHLIARLYKRAVNNAVPQLMWYQHVYKKGLSVEFLATR